MSLVGEREQQKIINKTFRVAALEGARKWFMPTHLVFGGGLNRVDKRPASNRYGVAILVTLVLGGIRVVLHPMLDDNLPFASLFLAILISAWYSGVIPAAVSMLLGDIVAALFILPSAPESSYQTGGFWIALLGFTICGSILILIIESVRSAERRAEASWHEQRKISLALRESSDRLRMAQQAARAGVWDWDLVSGGLILSPEYLALFGDNSLESEVKHENWVSTIHPSDRDRVRQALDNALRNGKEVNLEYRLANEESGSRWVQTIGKPVIGTSGGPTRLLGLTIDVTERKTTDRALVESEERYRSVFDHSPIPKLIVDPQSGKIVEVNTSAIDRYGYSRDEFLGMRLFDLLAEAEGGEDAPVDEPSGSVEVRHLTKNGSVVEVEITSTPLKLKDRKVLLYAIYDITERKMVEKTMRGLNEELEARVKLRTAELEAANRELEGFTYSIAHDMRTYLRSISVASRTIVEDEYGKLDDEGRENLELLGLNARQAVALVNSLLEFARLGRHEIKRVDVNMTAQAEAIAASLDCQPECQDVAFHIEPAMKAHADLDLMRMVLSNLLENACKYRSKERSTVIEIGTLRTNSKPVFFVRDNGIGFEMEFSHKLFRPFERLHRDADYPGTGIGLANVKRIVEKHGGRVWAESILGQGSTFYFTVE